MIDKPSGWTSFDVVKKVRNLSNERKVGHTGTLDPLATGLLILTLGPACKRAGEFVKLSKSYHVKMKLGYKSETGDAEGRLEPISNRRPSLDEIKAVLKTFLGKQTQTPPKYSAIKVRGVPAYKRARRGEEFELKTRPIEVKLIELISYKYPLVEFKTDVSSGTYIRTLVEDIGEQLKTGAFTSSLCRTQIGHFRVDDAVKVSSLDKTQIERRLISIAR